MRDLNRRAFLRTSGLSAIPLIAPALPVLAGNPAAQNTPLQKGVQFLYDGMFYTPGQYIQVLQEINKETTIQADNYGRGGAVEALEKKFEEITGKEKAIFMPTGTMANQFAIKVLSGENTKVFVQETSHVFRDEADAAQSVHMKRLVPVAKGKTCFTAEELQQAVEYHKSGEVFPSGMGVVSIENPVRRTEGGMVSMEELKKISSYCRKEGLKMHLDGARLFMAGAWSGTSIREYSALFDTVYISLYKYLGASAGAILCGPKEVIAKMPHLMKIHGGAMFGNWTNAAMALKHVDGLEARLSQAKKKADELFSMLNKLPQIRINPIPDGTNIFNLQLAPGLNGDAIAKKLLNDHGISIRRITNTGAGRILVNESILNMENNQLFEAFRNSLQSGM